MHFLKLITATLFAGIIANGDVHAQHPQVVTVVKEKDAPRVDVLIGSRPFTSFFYPDTLEKPVLYPLYAANGTIVTRGYPLRPRAGEPVDHPHHIGMWLNFENVNGLDFWNNSFAIPADKKKSYGWIKTDNIIETRNGTTGILRYQASWNNQQHETLLQETTRFAFSGTEHDRIIDRTTTLKAVTDIAFKDAKDGMLGLRLARELQLPSMEDKKFTDNHGIVTTVKALSDSMATGNYITSEGATGDSAWGTRARWCKVYGKMGSDSISITIIDHPANFNYPVFWHARGYGLFAANPLGEKIFTNGKSEKNLALKKGESVTFRYRVVIHNGRSSLTPKEINALADAFANTR